MHILFVQMYVQLPTVHVLCGLDMQIKPHSTFTAVYTYMSTIWYRIDGMDQTT